METSSNVHSEKQIEQTKKLYSYLQGEARQQTKEHTKKEHKDYWGHTRTPKRV
jgi:hypothetical protein